MLDGHTAADTNFKKPYILVAITLFVWYTVYITDLQIGENMENEKKVTKEERIVDYIKSVAAIDEALEPFKEQKKALKTNYVENGWLDKEEIKMAMKAYKMIKDDVDLDQLMDFYETVGRSV